MAYNRKSLRLPNYDYSKGGKYFITVCVKSKVFLFGDIVAGKLCINDIGKVVYEKWLWLEQHYSFIKCDAFIVMPNHIHGIIVMSRGGSRTAPTSHQQRKPVGRVIGAFKTVSTKEINLLMSAPGTQIWQRNFYERIIRNKNELYAVRNYIKSNPSNWADDPDNPVNIKHLSK